ncbi:hypothetical protein HC931_07345 [Candidatus Gracilibacteria bacterium]|nr:hypothetical protein [Candidatus Gracilibacteria bacterium]
MAIEPISQLDKTNAVAGSGAYRNTNKRFRIVMSTIGVPGFKKSIETYEVGFAQLSQKSKTFTEGTAKFSALLRLTEFKNFYCGRVKLSNGNVRSDECIGSWNNYATDHSL